MLDSSEAKTQSDSKFDPMTYLYQTCEIHKVSISANVIGFKKGWAGLIEELIIKLKEYPVKVCGIDDSNGQLHVKFAMLKQRNEVKVWRLLDELRIQSINMCMECGYSSYRVKTYGSNIKLCLDCHKNASKLGNTGTWLDSY